MRARNAVLKAGFDSNVFINCPFDEDYYPLLRPLLFAILYLGFTPRIALERSDSGENRIDKIAELLASSKYSIHDLSRLVRRNSRRARRGEPDQHLVQVATGMPMNEVFQHSV